MTLRRWFVGLIALGLALRAWHYLRYPSIWHDEAALVINVLNLNFSELLGSLIHHEAAPPLFLWLERAVSLVWNDGLYALRFIPFLASCASLILFALLCIRLLPSPAIPWVVGWFAVSDRLLWHTCEAKPYALDVFCAVSMAYGYVCTRHWSISKQCLFWLPLVPLIIWISYPGCFLCGGLLIALLVQVWHSKSLNHWLLWLNVAVVIGLAFVTLALGPAKAQRDGAMESCWLNQFANWDKPWLVPIWSITSTFDVFRYLLLPFGFPLLFLMLFGVRQFWKEKRTDLLALLVVPMLAVWFASCLRSYPYGGSRVIIFLAPGLLLLVGAGLPTLFSWLQQPSQKLLWIPLWIFCLLPYGQTIYRLVIPWERADTHAAAQYVLQHRQADEAVASNHWEFEYLFRQVDHNQVFTLQKMPKALPNRLWLVVCGEPSQPVVEAFASVYDVLEEQRFAGMRVLRLLHQEKTGPKDGHFVSQADTSTSIPYNDSHGKDAND